MRRSKQKIALRRGTPQSVNSWQTSRPSNRAGVGSWAGVWPNELRKGSAIIAL